MSKCTDPDRVVILNFEADDDFMAELQVLKDEAAVELERQTQFNLDARRKYTEAIERFRVRMLGNREVVH